MKKSNKERRSKLWRDTFDLEDLSIEEIKRQEAIFELFQGESDVVEDLTMAKQVSNMHGKTYLQITVYLYTQLKYFIYKT